MTLKMAQKIAREEFGISIRKTLAGDYMVNFKGDPEEYAVYEDTIIDALSIAKIMYRNKYNLG
jgi:hypothetical protein